MDRITPRDIDARLKVIAETQPRSPQERINAAQIEADELAESWLARHGLFVLSAAMVATFCVVVGLRFADYVHDKTQADLRLYEQFQEGK